MRLPSFFVTFFILITIGIPPGWASPVKVATWNMEWFTQRPAGSPGVPRDVVLKSGADIGRLAGYARRLDADIIALEEVDSVAQIHKVFPPERYHIFITGDTITQRVALAVKHSLRAVQHPDLTELDQRGSPLRAGHHPLRRGLDVSVWQGGKELRILSIHLKAGCAHRKPSDQREACQTLKRQFLLLESWILERKDEGDDFLIIGDFNRILTPADPMGTILTRTRAMLLIPTRNYASPCWGGDYFIDHILLGNNATHWLKPDSLRVMTFDNAPLSQKQHLSDHCPVSVILNWPEKADQKLSSSIPQPESSKPPSSAP